MIKTHFDLPWKSWAIFSYHRKFSENVWKHLWGLQTIVGEFSESGRKSLENHQLKKNCYQYVSVYKQNNTRLLVTNYDGIYIFSFSTLYLYILITCEISSSTLKETSLIYACQYIILYIQNSIWKKYSF